MALVTALLRYSKVVFDHPLVALFLGLVIGFVTTLSRLLPFP